MGIFSNWFGSAEPSKGSDSNIGHMYDNTTTSFGQLSVSSDEEVLVFPSGYEGKFIMVGVNVKLKTPIKVFLPIYFEGKPEDAILKTEFVHDIRGLMPEVLSENWQKDCVDHLQKTIIRHINSYNRITPYDMETYITESILVMVSIGKVIGQPFTDDEIKPLFVRLLKNLSNQFGIPVELPINDIQG